jgi:RNA polymerase sigma-70 factor (ECF subfamily)
VKVEVVNRTRLSGRGEVSRYFGNYSETSDWFLAPGLVEGRPAVIVHDPDQPSGPPIYFMLLDWADGRLTDVRDFRYARYAVEDAELIDFS